MSVTVRNDGTTIVLVSDAGLLLEPGTSGTVTGRTPQLNASLAAGTLVLVTETTPATATVSPEELNLIDGAVPGTAAKGTVVVLDNDLMVDAMGIKNLRNVVANKTGDALAKGTLVAIGGYDTTLACPTVVKADADTGASTYVLPAAIADGETGIALAIGVVTGLNTNAGSVGDPVYLSATAGGWALAAPTGTGQISQQVGVISRKSATVGSITFFPALHQVLALGTGSIQDGAITAEKTSTEVQASLALADSSYQLEETGIPATDLATAVQNSLGKADDAAVGVEAGYKVARGVSAVTGTLAITTGLATVVSVTATLAEDAAATGTIATVTIPTQEGADAGKFTAKVWKPTAADNSAPIAADTAKSVAWIAIGT